MVKIFNDGQVGIYQNLMLIYIKDWPIHIWHHCSHDCPLVDRASNLLRLSSSSQSLVPKANREYDLMIEIHKLLLRLQSMGIEVQFCSLLIWFLEVMSKLAKKALKMTTSDKRGREEAKSVIRTTAIDTW